MGGLQFMIDFYYIYQKIINIFFKKLSISTYSWKVYPGFWTSKRSVSSASDCIVFDFSNDRMVHIGDQLFFLYSILSLSKIKNVYILNKGFVAPFWSELGLLIGEERINFPFDLITPAYAVSESSNFQLLNSNNCKAAFFYDFNDGTIQKPLGLHICSFFNDIYDLKYNYTIKDGEINLPSISHLGINGKYIIFNETINSGFFRKLLLDTDVFASYLSKFRRQGFKIILIGSDKDFVSKKNENFIDFDLRGRVSLIEIFALFNSSQCIYYLGFDNAFMHISCYSKKKSIILFRGRFTKSARNLHYRSINVALCRGSDVQQINYIK